jgi:hypothetical protein
MSLVALLGLLLVGCSDSSGPDPARNEMGGAVLVGQLDPGTQTFTLKQLEQEVPGAARIMISLLGDSLKVDTTAETVSIDVAIRNDGTEPLYPPAIIWLSELMPDGVTVENADLVPGPPDTIPTASPTTPLSWGFDYTTLLGGTNMLAPGETSGAKTWLFHVPGLTGFSLRAQAEFGMAPDMPQIAGLCFFDLNGDGIPEDGEPPLVRGRISASGPEGFEMTAVSDAEGHYSIPVTLPGLYTLSLWAYCRAEDCGGDEGHHILSLLYTTPNPLEVVLPPDADGMPVSYLDANFGAQNPGQPGAYPPAVFTESPFDSLDGSPYQYLGGWLRNSILHLRVGYTACEADQPFTLYWQVGPEASPLPSAHLYLVREQDGDCTTSFEQRLGFDLRTIWENMGRPQIAIRLRFQDYDGELHSFLLRPPYDEH